MRKPWLIILGGLAVGLVAYAGIYHRATSTQRSMEQSARPALTWLKNEYHLSDAQFAQVVQLHDLYHPKCAQMCRRIDEQNAKIQKLLTATNIVTPEIKHALAGAAQLRVECQSAMMRH